MTENELDPADGNDSEPKFPANFSREAATDYGGRTISQNNVTNPIIINNNGSDASSNNSSEPSAAQARSLNLQEAEAAAPQFKFDANLFRNEEEERAFREKVVLPVHRQDRKLLKDIYEHVN